jgi:hypothetical protein
MIMKPKTIIIMILKADPIELYFAIFIYICIDTKMFSLRIIIMVKQHQLHIGRIHADWCGHCISLNGEWSKMKHEIEHQMGRGLKNVKIEYHDFEDSEERKKQGHHIDKELEKYNEIFLAKSDNKVAIQGGFPTIFRILDGRLEYYTGERVTPALYSWMTHGIITKKSMDDKNNKQKKKGGKRTARKKGKKTRSHRKTNFFGRIFR